MRVLRKKLRLPDGIVAYTYRHTFTTDGLANGVGIATMAELLGHRNTSMIDRHYGHLDKMTDHLKSAVIKATRRDQPNDFSAIDGRQSNDPPS
jgi:integrase